MDNRDVVIVESGFREGMQKARRAVEPEELLPVLQKCVDAGFLVLELGTLKYDGYKAPQQSISEKLFPLAVKHIRRPKDVLFQALVGGTPDDVQMAADKGADIITLLSGASDYFIAQLLEGKPGGYKEVMKRFPQCVEAARRCGIKVNGAISFAFRSMWEGEIPYDTVADVVKTYLDAGVEELSLSDSNGLADPVLTYERTARLHAEFPEVSWFSHMHNTRGTGAANVWAGYKAGVRKFDASFAGVGGCPYFQGSTGNIATEDMVYLFEACGVKTGIDQNSAVEIAGDVETLDFNSIDSYALRFVRAQGEDLIPFWGNNRRNGPRI